MKTFFIVSAVALATSCNNAGRETATQPDSARSKGPTFNQVPATSPISNVITHYIELKNALASDEAEEAGKVAAKLKEAVNKVDPAQFPEEQKRVIGEQQEEIHENADHIEDNPDKIDHQSSHFDMLSDAMYLLVKAAGAGKTLYKIHCPTYNRNRGAIWLSEDREIRNPYFGKTKDTCGEVKEELK